MHLGRRQILEAKYHPFVSYVERLHRPIDATAPRHYTSRQIHEIDRSRLTLLQGGSNRKIESTRRRSGTPYSLCWYPPPRLQLSILCLRQESIVRTPFEPVDDARKIRMRLPDVISRRCAGILDRIHIGHFCQLYAMLLTNLVKSDGQPAK